MRRNIFVLAAALAVLPGRSFASDSDSYSKIAAKLSEKAAPKLKQKKIAILPFDYIDKHRSPGGNVVSEKLIDKFVDYGELSVIERSMMEKMLGELKLQSSGAIDAATAKELGKGLGVDAIVSGTLEDDENGKKTTINARIIKTDTFEILGSANGMVDKSWQDESPQQVSEETPAPRHRTKKSSWAPVAKTEENPMRPTGFFDLFLGVGSAKMGMTFQNTSFRNSCDIGFSFNGNPCTSTSYSKFDINDAQTGSSVPLGFRVGGFGEIVGGDFEMSFWQHATTKQTGLTGTLDGAPISNISLSDQYLKVFVFNLLSGDLFIRVPVSPSFFPYIGFGGGLTLNNIQSVAGGVKDGTGVILNQTTAGVGLRIPVGIRVKVADKLSLFAEGRYVWNWMGYDRGIIGETDSIQLSGLQFLGGIGFLF